MEAIKMQAAAKKVLPTNPSTISEPRNPSIGWFHAIGGTSCDGFWSSKFVKGPVGRWVKVHILSNGCKLAGISPYRRKLKELYLERCAIEQVTYLLSKQAIVGRKICLKINMLLNLLQGSVPSTKHQITWTITQYWIWQSCNIKLILKIFRRISGISCIFDLSNGNIAWLAVDFSFFFLFLSGRLGVVKTLLTRCWY